MAVSVKRIKEYFGQRMTLADARALKAVLDGGGGRGVRNVEATLETVNKLLDAHGVEVINGDTYDDFRSPFGDAIALYVNTGDTYNPTVLYDVGRSKFYVTTMGDWVETAERRGIRFR